MASRCDQSLLLSHSATPSLQIACRCKPPLGKSHFFYLKAITTCVMKRVQQKWVSVGTASVPTCTVVSRPSGIGRERKIAVKKTQANDCPGKRGKGVLVIRKYN